MHEQHDDDGTVHLSLIGDLDVSVVKSLAARLEEIKTSGHPLRLDLSRLAFIDSSGVQALLGAVTDARLTGWQLDIAPEVGPAVARAAEIVGIAQVLWPPDAPHASPH